MKYKRDRILIVPIMLAFLFIFTGMSMATPVPDTGQTKCFNDSQEIPCPQPGEPFYGQDAQYGSNTQSYTDLGNGVVRDNVTNLEWQQLSPTVYSCSEELTPTCGYKFENYTWDEANTYCENLTLGGHSDWRLPTIKELSTLVDNGRQYPGPTINTTYFPDTQLSGYGYWSSTTYANNPVYAWVVDFEEGDLGHFLKSEFAVYVRAVRDVQSSNNFIDNGDGTVTDTSTALMWEKATVPGTYTWQQALAYCENLTLGGHSDWRMPNRNELLSLVDYSRYNPAINTDYFSVTMSCDLWPYCYYWSSTTWGSNYPDLARVVRFTDGFVGNLFKYFDIYVRAVRGGSFSPTVINLSSFNATPKVGRVIVEWSTESETDNAGFNLYCSESENGGYIRINEPLIPAQGSSIQGASYEFVDKDVKNRKTYYYKLEDIDLKGTATMHGPVSATPRWIYRIYR